MLLQVPTQQNNPLRLPSNPYHITGALDLKIYSSKRFLHFGVAANNAFIGIADLECNCKMQCEGNVCFKFSKGKDAHFLTTSVPAFRQLEFEQYVIGAMK
jgi:hypothetical protein